MVNSIAAQNVVVQVQNHTEYLRQPSESAPDCFGLRLKRYDRQRMAAVHQVLREQPYLAVFKIQVRGSRRGCSASTAVRPRAPHCRIRVCFGFADLNGTRHPLSAFVKVGDGNVVLQSNCRRRTQTPHSARCTMKRHAASFARAAKLSKLRS